MAGDVKSYQGYDQRVIPCTIALGSATSGGIDLGEWTYAAFVMPSAWTTTALTGGATITFQVSTNNSTWGNLYDDSRSEVTAYATASDRVTISGNLVNFLPWRYIKVRNGPSTAPGTQAAERILYFVVK